MAVLDLLEKFLKAIEDSLTANPLQAQKCFLSKEKAEECQGRVTETAIANHFDSRKAEQRLNLNFLYSFVQAKYAGSMEPTFGLTPYTRFMSLRRSIEIAQVNKNINGVLEAFRKLIKGSLELAV